MQRVRNIVLPAFDVILWTHVICLWRDGKPFAPYPNVPGWAKAPAGLTKNVAPLACICMGLLEADLRCRRSWYHVLGRIEFRRAIKVTEESQISSCTSADPALLLRGLRRLAPLVREVDWRGTGSAAAESKVCNIREMSALFICSSSDFAFGF